jgi:hypothetical protein
LHGIADDGGNIYTEQTLLEWNFNHSTRQAAVSQSALNLILIEHQHLNINQKNTRKIAIMSTQTQRTIVVTGAARGLGVRSTHNSPTFFPFETSEAN